MSPGAIAGSCYGFAVRSDLDFRFLREGGGRNLDLLVSAEPVDVDGATLLQEWKSAEAPRHPMRVYRDGALYRVSSDLGWFTVDPLVPSIAVPETDLDIGREQIATVTGMLLCFHAAGDTGLHAAAVEVDGEAIVLAAPGTFGKTTLAAAFWRAGYRVLTEDLVCLRSSNGFSALAGPAMIRLRRDVAEQLDLPDAEVVIETPSRVCFALAGKRRGTSDPVPIRAVVILLPSEDELRLELADKPDAVRDLWTLCGLFPTEEDYERRFNVVADLVEAVPVYNLERALRFHELDRVIERIVGGV